MARRTPVIPAAAASQRYGAAVIRLTRAHLRCPARYIDGHLEPPGLTETVEAADWKRAAEQADLLVAAFDRNTRRLRAAATEWSAGR